MAGPGNSSGGGMEFFKFVQDRDNDSETKGQTFFKSIKKVNGAWAEVESFNRFEGQLVKVELGSYEYEGETVDTANLYIEAGGIIYKVGMNFNYTTRALFNSLLGEPEYVANHPFVVSTYMKDGYGKIWVGKNTGTGREHALGWKFEMDQVPKVDEVLVGTRKIKDDSKVNDFFKQWLNHTYVNSGILKGVTSPEPTVQEAAQAPQAAPSNLPPPPGAPASPQQPTTNLPPLPPTQGPGQSAPPSGSPLPYQRPSPVDMNLPDPNDDLPF